VSGASSEPAYLDDAGTVSFRDADHFATEMDLNVLHGRALLRTRRTLAMNQSIQLRIRAPNDAGETWLTGRVVFVQNDLVGLQIGDLDAAKKAALQAMAAAAREPPGCTTPSVESAAHAPPGSASTEPAVSGAPAGSGRAGASRAEPPGASPPVALDAAAEGPTGTVDVRAAHAHAPSADLAPAEPRESPEAPAPFTPAQLAARWPRVGANGTADLRDEGVALALYLLALRCGRVVLDAEAAPPDLDRIRFELRGRSATVPVRPIRLEGSVGLFEVEDPVGLADLLEDAAPVLAPMLEGVGLCATGDLATPNPETTSVPGAADRPEAPPPPTPPRLEGDVVEFAAPSDLERELKANIQNGGLFVESPPVPLRTRIDLRFRVRNTMLPQTLPADVVFADGGRVGFSFVDAAKAHAQLSEAVEAASALASGASPSGDLRPGTTTLDIRVGTDDVVPPFSGELTRALQNHELVDLAQRRIRDPAELTRTSTLQLFDYIVRSEWTGVLRLRSTDGAERNVHLYRGDVAFVVATPFEEHTSLGRILVAQRKVNETQLREALDRSKGSHRLLGRMLVLLGVLKRRDLTSALREQTRAKMESAFSWSSGRFDWGPWVEPPGEADLVVTKGLTVLERHLRNRFETMAFGDLESILESSLDQTVVPTDMDVLATSLRLGPRELRFIELQLDGTRTIHDAVTGSPLGRLGSLRLIAVGLALGVLRLSAADAKRPPSTPASSPSHTPRKPHDELREQLRERLREIRAGSHFDTLRVHWSSHHREYRKAWEVVRGEVDLTKPPLADAPEDVRWLAREVIREIDAARDVLESKEQRIAYRKQMFDKTERQYAAEMLLKQGEIALLRGDRTAALESLETAAELSPNPKTLELLRNARERR